MQDIIYSYSKLLTLLLKPYWGNQDIFEYFSLTQAPICLKKVIKIRRQAELLGGAVSYVQCKVSVESVMGVIGKQLDIEIGRYSVLSRKEIINE